MWLYVVAGALMLLVLVLAARLLAVRIAWRRVRRRLAVGVPAEQITGAWTWMRLRLEACRLPLSAAVSPDLVVAGSSGNGLPPEVCTPLQTLATVTTRAAFGGGQSPTSVDATTAWTAAGRVDQTARGLLPRRTRIGMAFRGPDARAKNR